MLTTAGDQHAFVDSGRQCIPVYSKHKHMKSPLNQHSTFLFPHKPFWGLAVLFHALTRGKVGWCVCMCACKCVLCAICLLAYLLCTVWSYSWHTYSIQWSSLSVLPLVVATDVMVLPTQTSQCCLGPDDQTSSTGGGGGRAGERVGVIKSIKYS